MEGKTKLMKGGGEGTKMAYILFEHTNFICQVCKYLTGIKKNAPEGNKLHLHVMYLKDISEILPLDPFTQFFQSLLLGCHNMESRSSYILLKMYTTNGAMEIKVFSPH